MYTYSCSFILICIAVSFVVLVLFILYLCGQQ
nr:MAG TPA: hypothetical protein [Caudoviricetes sp.]